MTARRRLAAGWGLVLGALTVPSVHASENPANVSIAARPNVAVMSVGGLQLSTATHRATVSQATLGEGARASLSIDGGDGEVTVNRASDLVGRPVDLVSYARIRAAIAARAAAAAAGKGLMPVGSPLNASSLTSGFGMRRHPLFGGYRPHLGVDLAAPMGTPIFAPSDGVVGRADWAGGYGLLVALEHGKGVQSRYGHLSRLNVSAGQRVRKGDVIGFVGSTGRSTGPHLHYEVRVDGRPVNPHLHRSAP